MSSLKNLYHNFYEGEYSVQNFIQKNQSTLAADESAKGSSSPQPESQQNKTDNISSELIRQRDFLNKKI